MVYEKFCRLLHYLDTTIDVVLTCAILVLTCLMATSLVQFHGTDFFTSLLGVG